MYSNYSLNINPQWNLKLSQTHKDGSWKAILNKNDGCSYELESNQIVNTYPNISSQKFFEWVATHHSAKGIEKLFEIIEDQNQPLVLKIGGVSSGLLGGQSIGAKVNYTPQLNSIDEKKAIEDKEFKLDKKHLKFINEQVVYSSQKLNEKRALIEFEKTMEAFKKRPEKNKRNQFDRLGLDFSRSDKRKDLDVFQESFFNPYEKEKRLLNSLFKRETSNLASIETKSEIDAILKRTGLTLSELIDHENKFNQDFLKYGWTHGQYVCESLYNPEYGYYGAGRVKFISDNSHGDFVTYASKGTALAEQLAFQIFEMWKMMVESGDLSLDETFTVIEGGAGNGDLSKNILSYIEEKCQDPKNKYWKKLFKVIDYQIAEFSPGLRDRQKENNKKFIEMGKLTVKAADARNLPKTFKNPIKGLVLSNELLDAFPSEHIRFNEKNELEILYHLPTLSKEDFRNTFSDYPEELEKWEKESDRCKAFFNDSLKDFDLSDEIIFSPSLIAKIPSLEGSKDFDKIASIKWWHLFLNPENFPKLKEFLGDIEIDHKLESGTNINPGAASFMKGASEILEKGYVISVDYGDDSGPLTNRERLYPINAPSRANSNENSDYHNSLGKYDITISVNFTRAAEAGLNHQLKPIQYTPQTTLNKIKRTFDKTSTIEGLVTSGFMVLLQQKMTKDTKSKFFFRDVSELRPVTYHEKFLKDIGVNKGLASENNVRLYARALIEYLIYRLREDNPLTFSAYFYKKYNKAFDLSFLVRLTHYNHETQAYEELNNYKELSPVQKDFLKRVIKTYYEFYNYNDFL